MGMRMSRECMSMDPRRRREFTSQVYRYFSIHFELGRFLTGRYELIVAMSE